MAPEAAIEAIPANQPSKGDPAAELEGLLVERLLPAHRDRWGDSREWDALVDFQRQLGAHGWTAPGWPPELGGRGLDVGQQVACEAVFHRTGAPQRVAVYGVNNVGPTIAAVGTPEQRRHVRAIVEVTELWCQGFSEPDAGSDLASLRARATVTDDGFVVDGQKIWTSIGMHATHCMLLVRTDPDAPRHRGISALLVPMDTPGITRRPIRQIDGEADFAEVFFDRVHLPRSALLGPLHEGWRVTMTTLGFERAGVLAAAGHMAAEAERTVRDLQAAGRLNGTARDRAVSLLIEARLLRLTGERALAAESGTPGPLSTIIKLGWSQLGNSMGRLAVDAAGVGGVAGMAGLAAPRPPMPRKSTPAADRLLRSLSFGIAGGTTEVLHNLIGERVLGLPKEPRG